MKSDYSEKELDMIYELSPNWYNIIDRDEDRSVLPPMLLGCLAQECFIENRQGEAVESLRRCLQALNKSKPYRKTPEYDKLIQS